MRILAVLIGLIAAVSGVVLLVWLLWRLWVGDEEQAAAAIEIEVPEPKRVGAPLEMEEQEEAPSEPAVSEALPQAEEADDLRVIEGIGPKISQVLREAGLVTFAQLADTEPGDIQAILEASDPRLGRLADPGTWPSQAALAAKGDWDALAALQDELKGGRKA